MGRSPSMRSDKSISNVGARLLNSDPKDTYRIWTLLGYFKNLQIVIIINKLTIWIRGRGPFPFAFCRTKACFQSLCLLGWLLWTATWHASLMGICWKESLSIPLVEPDPSTTSIINKFLDLCKSVKWSRYCWSQSQQSHNIWAMRKQ